MNQLSRKEFHGRSKKHQLAKVWRLYCRGVKKPAQSAFPQTSQRRGGGLRMPKPAKATFATSVKSVLWTVLEPLRTLAPSSQSLMMSPPRLLGCWRGPEFSQRAQIWKPESGGRIPISVEPQGEDSLSKRCFHCLLNNVDPDQNQANHHAIPTGVN